MLYFKKSEAASRFGRPDGVFLETSWVTGLLKRRRRTLLLLFLFISQRLWQKKIDEFWMMGLYGFWKRRARGLWIWKRMRERLHDGFLSDLWLLFLDGTGGMRLFDCCVVFDMEQGRWKCSRLEQGGFRSPLRSFFNMSLLLLFIGDP